MRLRMQTGAISLLCVLLAAGTALAQNVPPPPPPNASAASSGQPVELDHVVAMIGSNVLLASDLRQEMHLAVLEPLRVLPGQNTPLAALRRLIDRTLILQQMKEQQQPLTTPEPEVDKALVELRRQIPDCAKDNCETDQGWHAFLEANDLTPALVEQRWSQRMAILRFIDLRFRTGIAISHDQIAAYYQKTLVPALVEEHRTPPPLAQVASRVQELLLQQQVSGLFEDWLSSLRDQGNVQIVDQTYAAGLSNPSGTADSDTTDKGPSE